MTKKEQVEAIHQIMNAKKQAESKRIKIPSDFRVKWMLENDVRSDLHDRLTSDQDY